MLFRILQKLTLPRFNMDKIKTKSELKDMNGPLAESFYEKEKPSSRKIWKKTSNWCYHCLFTKVLINFVYIKQINFKMKNHWYKFTQIFGEKIIGELN